MSTTTLTVAGARLHVIDDGAAGAPPLLLLHAGIADSRAWDAIVPSLVDAGYRVIRFDRRGFGRSETEDVPFSNRADVIAVMDSLGISRAVLVGNSQGGQIAFDTAIEFPDRVVAVVGVGAGLGGYEGDVTPEEIALFDRMDALETKLEAAGPAGDPGVLADLVALDVEMWVDGPRQSNDRVPAAVRDLVATMDAEHYAPDRLQGQAIPLQPRAAERLADLRCPVLAVAGALDVSEVASTARHLEATAPDARAVILPDVAHMVGMETPERLATLIVEFLAPVPRWS